MRKREIACPADDRELAHGFEDRVSAQHRKRAAFVDSVGEDNVDGEVEIGAGEGETE